MSDLRLSFDRDGIPAPVADVLDDVLAGIQTWANIGVLDRKSYATFVQPRCRYFLPSAQTIADSTTTAIQWSAIGHDYPMQSAQLDVIHYDNGDTFGHKFLRADGEYLVPPVAGQYLTIVNIGWNAHATGYRYAALQQRGLNGDVFDLSLSVLPANSASISSYQSLMHVVTVRDPAQTGFEDGVRVAVSQTSGGNLDLLATSASTYIQMIKVS